MPTGCITFQSTKKIHVFENVEDAEYFERASDEIKNGDFVWIGYPNISFEDANFPNVKNVIKHPHHSLRGSISGA